MNEQEHALLDQIGRQLSHQPLFITVSGAHLYGFPSPDSDFDLRGARILPLETVTGLDDPEETITYTFEQAGREIDLVSHAIKKFLKLLLNKNGYVLEQLYSSLVVRGGSAFEKQNPELAAFGTAQLHGQVAYLATVRKDGSPRVHPMTPIIGQGHLFVFMEPTSPKGHDLRRDGRYALHCGVSDTGGTSGEFSLRGQAQLIDTPEIRTLAVQLAPYSPAERYILFELSLESAASTVYEGDRVIRQHWQRESL